MSDTMYACVVLAYLAPAMIAGYRHHPNATPILLVNVFLGWTFLGWVAALVWSAMAIAKPPPPEPARVVVIDGDLIGRPE